MATLTLTDLPEVLLGSLETAAKTDGRSFSQEIVLRLETSLRDSSGKTNTMGSDRDAQLEVWRRLSGQWISSRDEASEIDDIVSQRTLGREVDF